MRDNLMKAVHAGFNAALDYAERVGEQKLGYVYGNRDVICKEVIEALSEPEGECKVCDGDGFETDGFGDPKNSKCKSCDGTGQTPTKPQAQGEWTTQYLLTPMPKAISGDASARAFENALAGKKRLDDRPRELWAEAVWWAQAEIFSQLERAKSKAPDPRDKQIEEV